MLPEHFIRPLPLNSAITLEEYALYSMIIVERLNRSAREQFVIRKELVASTPLVKGQFLEWRSKLEGLQEETAQAFVALSREPAVLEEYLDLPLPYALLAEDESSDIWDWNDERTFSGRSRDGWKVFRELYPNAGPIISFSRIGFNRARTQGLVERGVRAHWAVCGGALLLLEKGETGWKIEKGHGLWLPEHASPVSQLV